MDIDSTFLPVAEELVGSVFPTQITYFQNTGTSYDPSTGDVTQNIAEYKIPAGVLSRGRAEDGGVTERYELRLWLHHGRGGLPALPSTADTLEYDGTTWKVTTVEPTYSSKALIASKVTARSN